MLTLTQKSHCLTTSLLYLVSFYHDISVSINVATRSLYLDSYPENSLWGKNAHGLFIFPQVQTTVNDWHLWWYKAFFFRRGLPKAPNQAPGCSTQWAAACHCASWFLLCLAPSLVPLNKSPTHLPLRTPTSDKTHVLWFWVQWFLHYRILPDQRKADNTWF